MIAPAMRARIEAALAALELAHGLRILFAAESGSRAWGFPSPDSDYDVRFVFARPRDAYLSVQLPRDTIEAPPDDELDLSGWDVRKALQLALRSNAPLLEWLASPIQYRTGPDMERLRRFCVGAGDLTALAYHYDRTARRSLDEIAAGADVRLKAYCYALRPALALSWLRRRQAPPPMDLPALVAGFAPAPDERAAIDALVAAKAGAAERATTPRLPVLDALLAGLLAERAPRPDPRAPSPAEADALLRSIIAERP